MQIVHFCKVVIDPVFTKHVISMQYTLKGSLYCNLMIFIFSTNLYSKWEVSHILVIGIFIVNLEKAKEYTYETLNLVKVNIW